MSKRNSVSGKKELWRMPHLMTKAAKGERLQHIREKSSEEVGEVNL